MLVEALDRPHADVNEQWVVEAAAATDLRHFTDAVKSSERRGKEAVGEVPTGSVSKVGELLGEIVVGIL